MARDRNHHLYRRGGIWYFQMKGQKFSLHTTSVTEARRQRDRYHQDMVIYGRIPSEQIKEAPEFGELAVKWFELNKTRLKKATFKDYKNSMNNFIIPRFGNVPVDKIQFLDIETFKANLGVKNKRIINLFVPMRNVFKMAVKAGYIDRNPMDLIDPIEPEKPEIEPFSFEEVQLFLKHVDPYYEPFFTVLFFTGMRFSEAAALKWRRVDFDMGVIKVREALVQGEEDRTKTPGSVRDVKILPMVLDALERQKKTTYGKSPYVFLNKYDRPMKPCPTTKVAWAPALTKTGLEYRTMMHTRHTYITMMLDSGEHVGWVARQVGHTSPKMIFERYYSYIRNYQSEDGQKFMDTVYAPGTKNGGETYRISTTPEEHENGQVM